MKSMSAAKPWPHRTKVSRSVGAAGRSRPGAAGRGGTSRSRQYTRWLSWGRAGTARRSAHRPANQAATFASAITPGRSGTSATMASHRASITGPVHGVTPALKPGGDCMAKPTTVSASSTAHQNRPVPSATRERKMLCRTGSESR